MAEAQVKKKKKKKIDEALEASRVSASLDEREKGFLGRFIENSSKWWSTDPEEQEKQLFPARPSDGGPLYKNRDQVWGRQARTFKPGPGHPEYKGPIQNKEMVGKSGQPIRPRSRSLAEQDAIIETRRGDLKTDRQYELERERRKVLGENKPITPEEAEAQVIADREKRRAESLNLQNYQPDEPEFQAQKEMREREQMGASMNQASLIDVFAEQAVPKLKDPNDKYSEDDYEADIALAASESQNPRETKAKLREATGDYYIDPVSGFALDLRQLNKAIDRKQFMEEAALLPADSRAQFLADKGVIKQSDVKLNDRQKKEQKLLDLKLTKATLDIEKLKADDPNKKMMTELLKQAIASKNAALVGVFAEGLNIKDANGKDIDIAAIQKSFNASTKKSLKDTGRYNVFKANTGLDPDKYIDRKGELENKLLDFGKPADEFSGRAATVGKREMFLNSKGINTWEQYTAMDEAGQIQYLQRLGVGLKEKNPNIPMEEIQRQINRMPKLEGVTDENAKALYRKWAYDTGMFLGMRSQYEGDSYGLITSFLRNHVQQERDPDTVTRVESKAIGEEGTDYDKKNEEIIDTGPEPVPDMTNAEEAIQVAADNASGANEQKGLLQKNLENITPEELASNEKVIKEIQETQKDLPQHLQESEEQLSNRRLRELEGYWTPLGFRAHLGQMPNWKTDEVKWAESKVADELKKVIAERDNTPAMGEGMVPNMRYQELESRMFELSDQLKHIRGVLKNR